MINFQSLTHRLYLALAGALIFLTMLIFAISNFVLQDKSERLYDNMLVAVSKNIDDKLYVKDNKLKLDMDYFSVDTLSEVRSEKIFYRIVAPDGRLLAGFEGLALAEKSGNESVYFYQTQYAGTPLRAVQYASRTKLGTAYIVVAESMQGRKATLDGIQKQITFATVLTCLVAMLLVAFLVQRALKPLNKLQKEIKLRSESNLEPITFDVPPEVNALVESLNKLMARLHKSIKASQNFNADLSHQLRTPLAEMKMQLSLCREEKRADDSTLDALEHNITLMARMTHQMLHYAKAQNSSITDEYWRVVDVVDFCKEFCCKHAAMIFNKGQSIAFESELVSVRCRVDEVMLESALLNLVENSLKYASSDAEDREITLSVTMSNSLLDISVKDQGPGVDEDRLNDLIERRVRIDQNKQGFGLGLSIAREVAAMHGGSLKVENVTPGFKVSIVGLEVLSDKELNPLL